jgi:alanine racemase
MQSSYFEISKSALKHNIEFLRNFIHKDVRISSVVKGNAYGHGFAEFVPLVEANKINHFSVFSAHEALQVKAVCKGSSKIMIMGFIDDNEMPWVIENEIEFYVFDVYRLQQAVKWAKKIKKRAKIHIEIETGMNRTGFSLKEIPEVIQLITNNRNNLTLSGLCTHYAGAESITNYYRIKKQQQLFNQVSKKYFSENIKPATRHTACSAAALRYPKSQMDMVRLGIVQYGFFPNNELAIEYLTKNKNITNPLRRLISWKSKVMVTKNAKAGEFIGYGTSYMANSDKKIAIVSVGYSNGYTRALSNLGRVIVNGQYASVIGTINMNMVTIDVTNIDNVERGTDVILIGKQDDVEISVSSFNEFSDLVNYELLTRLPKDLPRVIIN